MIAHLKVTLSYSSSGSVVIDVSGVGYEVSIPLSTYYGLPEIGSKVDLMTHTFVRDDAIKIFGFLTYDEKELFQLLIGVSGIGPKLACNIISGTSVDGFFAAISSEDLATIQSIPGIGKKTAQRVILELKDKVAKLELSHKGVSKAGKEGGFREDAISALLNLGYRQPQANEAITKATESLGDDAGLQDILKEALRIVSEK